MQPVPRASGAGAPDTANGPGLQQQRLLEDDIYYQDLPFPERVFGPGKQHITVSCTGAAFAKLRQGLREDGLVLTQSSSANEAEGQALSYLRQKGAFPTELNEPNIRRDVKSVRKSVEPPFLFEGPQALNVDELLHALNYIGKCDNKGRVYGLVILTRRSNGRQRKSDPYLIDYLSSKPGKESTDDLYFYREYQYLLRPVEGPVEGWTAFISPSATTTKLAASDTNAAPPESASSVPPALASLEQHDPPQVPAYPETMTMFKATATAKRQGPTDTGGIHAPEDQQAAAGAPILPSLSVSSQSDAARMKRKDSLDSTKFSTAGAPSIVHTHTDTIDQTARVTLAVLHSHPSYTVPSTATYPQSSAPPVGESSSHAPYWPQQHPQPQVGGMGRSYPLYSPPPPQHGYQPWLGGMPQFPAHGPGRQAPTYPQFSAAMSGTPPTATTSTQPATASRRSSHPTPVPPLSATEAQIMTMDPSDIRGEAVLRLGLTMRNEHIKVHLDRLYVAKGESERGLSSYTKRITAAIKKRAARQNRPEEVVRDDFNSQRETNGVNMNMGAAQKVARLASLVNGATTATTSTSQMGVTTPMPATVPHHQSTATPTATMGSMAALVPYHQLFMASTSISTPMVTPYPQLVPVATAGIAAAAQGSLSAAAGPKRKRGIDGDDSQEGSVDRAWQ